MCGELREQADKDMADTIIQISISNNKKTYQRLKKENDMSQALEELMEDRITASAAESRAEGRKEERADLSVKTSIKRYAPSGTDCHCSELAV